MARSVTKKIWLALSITINLLTLCYFKYAYFFAGSVNDLLGTDFTPVNIFAQWSNTFLETDFSADKILLPVGISFFTFQTISYTVDIYRGLIKPVKNIVDFGFFVSFFPQLVAGPIVRAADFVPQLHREVKLSADEFGRGIFLIINGLLKKIILADYIAVNFIDRVFSNPSYYSGFENLMALYGYSLQVYADFSGYTDMAIGIALLMGFHLPKNFNSPYKAINVAEFWGRWHISLSSWLKDYLYIPMGGNRGSSLFSKISLGFIVLFICLLSASWLAALFILGSLIFLYVLTQISDIFKKWSKTNINMMLTMLIGGLWHGASWNFVFWGGLNGVGLLVYKLFKKVLPSDPDKFWWRRALGIFITLNFITFTRIWFRADSYETANQILFQIGDGLGNLTMIGEMMLSYRWVFITMVIGYVIHWIPQDWKEFYIKVFVNSPFVVKTVVGALVIFIAYQFVVSDMQPFIYFAF